MNYVSRCEPVYSKKSDILPLDLPNGVNSQIFREVY